MPDTHLSPFLLRIFHFPFLRIASEARLSVGRQQSNFNSEGNGRFHYGPSQYVSRVEPQSVDLLSQRKARNYIRVLCLCLHNMRTIDWGYSLLTVLHKVQGEGISFLLQQPKPSMTSLQTCRPKRYKQMCLQR